MSNKSDNSDKREESDKSDKPKICTFYIQFRCKFGPQGKDCPFDHPKICRSFMKSGNKGCDKGENCTYVHPSMCNKSLKGQNCNSLRCHKGHFMGLRDLNSNPQSNSQSREESPQRTRQDFHQDAHSENKPIKHLKDSPPMTVTPPVTPSLTPPTPPSTARDGVANFLLTSYATADEHNPEGQRTGEGRAEKHVDLHDEEPASSSHPASSPSKSSSPSKPSSLSCSSNQSSSKSLLLCDYGDIAQPRGSQVLPNQDTVIPATIVDTNPPSMQIEEPDAEQTHRPISNLNAILATNIRAVIQSVQPQAEKILQKTQKNTQDTKKGKGEEGETGNALPPPPLTKKKLKTTKNLNAILATNTHAVTQSVQPQKEKTPQKTQKNTQNTKKGQGEEGETGNALPPLSTKKLKTTKKGRGRRGKLVTPYPPPPPKKILNPQKPKKSSLISLNIRGLIPGTRKDKLIFLSSLGEESEAELILVTETHLSEKVADSEVAIPGWGLARSDRLNRQSGGTLIYYRDQLTTLYERSFSNSYTEVTMLYTPSSDSAWIVTYCPPR